MLPPGQRARQDFPRFGRPQFAKRLPTIPNSPELRLAGDVKHPDQIALTELGALPRVAQVSDFHCVTSWSTLGLRWEGVRCVDFLDWVYPRLDPDSNIRWIGLVGADGHSSALPLEFARAPDVLLADTLDGEPLSLAHGQPLRLIAPAHYAYKSVKHITEIHLLRGQPRSVLGLFREHPVGLVASEQRARGLPGRLCRYLLRPVIPSLVNRFRKAIERNAPPCR